MWHWSLVTRWRVAVAAEVVAEVAEVAGEAWAEGVAAVAAEVVAQHLR